MCVLRRVVLLASAASCEADPAWVEFFDFRNLEFDWIDVSPIRPGDSGAIPQLSSEERAQLWLSRIRPAPGDLQGGLRYSEALSMAEARLSDGEKRDIEVDLLRSGPAILATGKTDILGRVLMAFTMRRPDIGYVQGMNYVAAEFLVMGFRDVDVFNGLVYFVESLGDGYFYEEFPGFYADVETMRHIVETVDPDLHTQLTVLQQVEPHIPVFVSLLYDCLLTFFARPLAPAVLLRVWDAIFLHGKKAVFATVLALLRREHTCFVPRADSPMENFGCFQERLTLLRRDHVEAFLQDVALLLPRINLDQTRLD